MFRGAFSGAPEATEMVSVCETVCPGVTVTGVCKPVTVRFGSAATVRVAVVDTFPSPRICRVSCRLAPAVVDTDGGAASRANPETEGTVKFTVVEAFTELFVALDALRPKLAFVPGKGSVPVGTAQTVPSPCAPAGTVI